MRSRLASGLSAILFGLVTWSCQLQPHGGSGVKSDSQDPAAATGQETDQATSTADGSPSASTSAGDQFYACNCSDSASDAGLSLFDKQQKSLWCWAASASELARSVGVAASQQQLVQAVFGPSLPNQAADAPTIVQALHDVGVTGARIASANVAYSEVAQGAEAMVGYQGHMRVMTSVDAAGNVYMLDPWPTVPTDQTIPWGVLMQVGPQFITAY